MKTWYLIVVMSLAVSGNAQNPLCTFINAPYSEDFQSSDWVISSSFFGRGSVDTCWNRTPFGKVYFKPGPPSSTGSSGASVDHTLGNASGKYIYSEFGFGSGTGGTATITSPSIVLTSLNNPELTFWYHMFGSQIEDLKVAISADSGQTYTNVFTRSGPQHFANTDPWTEANIDLSSYLNDTIIIRFQAIQTTNGFNTNICIDDFSIDEKPICPKPQNINMVGSTHNSITLDWTSGGASNWQIEYSEVGTAGTTTINVNQKPFTLTGLNPSSTYQISVRDSCGPASLSASQGPVSMTTDCTPNVAPYIEDFDGSNFMVSSNVFLPGTIDTCWDKLSNSQYQWNVEQGQTNLFGTGPDKDHTTGNGKYLLSQELFFSNQNISAWLETELIDVSPLNIPQLRFWYHMFGADIDSLNVEVFEGGQWHFVHTLVGQHQSASSDPWKEATVNLDSFSNKVIKLRFTGVRKSLNGDKSHIAIDDFEIREKPTCPKPSNLSANVPSGSSVQLNWTTGGANNWQIRYRQAGTAQPFTILSASSNPFTVTGLTPTTNYEFFVRDSCGPGDISTWLGPVKIATCVAITAPWYENFDGPTWMPGQAFSNGGNKIDFCWSRPDTAGADFGTRSGPTSSLTTGPVADFSGIGNYIYTEASLGTAGEITTPFIYLPLGVSNMQLKFAYHMFGSNISSLSVMVNNGNGFNTTIKNIIGPQHMSDIEPWKLDSVSLAAYIGDTVQFRFVGSNSGFRGDIAVDEVSVSGCDNVKAEFTYSSQNLQVSFNSSATVNADSLFWAFGDGSTDTATMPGHLYQVGGTYTVQLLGFNDCSTDTFSVNLEVCDTLKSLFSYQLMGDSVYLNADSSNNASGYLWELDNGMTASDSVFGVSYDSTGLKQIKLISFNNCGDTSVTDTVIEICPPPEAKWTYTLLGTNSAGTKIQFDASPSKNASKYIWDYGDGVIDSSGPMPVHTFSTPGLHHIVKLTVKNECGAEDIHQASLQSMVGLNEQKLTNKLQVYPNPASEHLTIKWEQQEDPVLSIGVYSLNGRKLHQVIPNYDYRTALSLDIDLSGWAPGIYLLKIVTKSGTETVKVEKAVP